MFRSLTSRIPTSEEEEALIELFREQREVFQETPEKAIGWIEVGEYPLPEEYEPADLAAYAVNRIDNHEFL